MTVPIWLRATCLSLLLCFSFGGMFCRGGHKAPRISNWEGTLVGIIFEQKDVWPGADQVTWSWSRRGWPFPQSPVKKPPTPNRDGLQTRPHPSLSYPSCSDSQKGLGCALACWGGCAVTLAVCVPGAVLVMSASAQAQKHGRLWERELAKACGPSTQEKRVSPPVWTPLCATSPAHDLGARAIKLWTGVKMLLKALTVEGQQHPQPGSWIPHHLPVQTEGWYLHHMSKRQLTWPTPEQTALRVLDPGERALCKPGCHGSKETVFESGSPGGEAAERDQV